MGKITEINGPIVSVELPQVCIGEQVRIGQQGLIGEVLARQGDKAVVQVYESTELLHPGEEAKALGHPLTVELGPGLLGQTLDGVQRPLHQIFRQSGDRIARGLNIPALDRNKLWSFKPTTALALGTTVEGGTILGTVPESKSFSHHILVPPDVRGELIEIAPAGEYSVNDRIARLAMGNGQSIELKLYHRWPVRTPRPYRHRDDAVEPLITGQRILDTLFPLLKGGKGAIPGPFGAGKTLLQHQIARWSNASIVLYVGCGERGNELVDILQSFPKLKDPHTGRSLMERTLLVANTSNMPVVAREASIYIGVTIAEYYRDQGVDVVMVADSTSRWAEALREVAGRLGQMPVEEGYPAYLASRLAAFYERAGRVKTLAGNWGSVTLIGAVSPPGGDFSEPVTSHTKEIVQTFWALSKPLADARHYPAVSWTDSFSGYAEIAAHWWTDNVDANWKSARKEALSLLTQADELTRIVNLVGSEALMPEQRWVLESAALIREGVLQQNALDPVDSFCSPKKQFALLDMMITIYQEGKRLLQMGVPIQQLLQMPLLTQSRRAKTNYENRQLDELKRLKSKITWAFDHLRETYTQTAEMGYSSQPGTANHPKNSS